MKWYWWTLIIIILLLVIYFVFVRDFWGGHSVYQNFKQKRSLTKQYNDCLNSPDTKRIALRDNKSPEELCKGLNPDNYSNINQIKH